MLWRRLGVGSRVGRRVTVLCEVVRESLHEKMGPEGNEGSGHVDTGVRMFQVEGATGTKPLSRVH